MLGLKKEKEGGEVRGKGTVFVERPYEAHRKRLKLPEAYGWARPSEALRPSEARVGPHYGPQPKTYYRKKVSPRAPSNGGRAARPPATTPSVEVQPTATQNLSAMSVGVSDDGQQRLIL